MKIDFPQELKKEDAVSFKAGAAWQEKQMFTREDMEKAFDAGEDWDAVTRPQDVYPCF